MSNMEINFDCSWCNDYKSIMEEAVFLHVITVHLYGYLTNYRGFDFRQIYSKKKDSNILIWNKDRKREFSINCNKLFTSKNYQERIILKFLKKYFSVTKQECGISGDPLQGGVENCQECMGEKLRNFIRAQKLNSLNK